MRSFERVPTYHLFSSLVLCYKIHHFQLGCIKAVSKVWAWLPNGWLLWLVDLNALKDCLVSQCIEGSRGRWEFPLFLQRSFAQPWRQTNACCRIVNWTHGTKYQWNISESEFYHFHSGIWFGNCRLPKWQPFCPRGHKLKLHRPFWITSSGQGKGTRNNDSQQNLE